MKPLRGFWLTFVLAVGLLLAPLVVMARMTGGELPPKPAFPMPGRSFVAEYGGVSAYLAHLLYYWDLLGFGDRIRTANVLLLGSSRVQFGLSADILATRLSRKVGKTITVYNAGLGCTASLDFAADYLRRLNVHGQVLVGDVYAMQSYFDPCLYEFFGVGDAGQAAFKIATVWTRFDLDWLLDGTLPRIEIRDGSLQVARYLDRSATLVDWNTGDVLEQYGPRGNSFPRPLPQDVRPVLEDRENVVSWRFDGDHMRALGRLPGLAEGNAKPVFTLIPYIADEAHKNGDYAVVEKLLSEGKSNDPPFIAIPPEGLATFDGFHLTGPSRTIATERLIDGMEAAGILSWFALDSGGSH